MSNPLYRSSDFSRAIKLPEEAPEGAFSRWRSPFRRDYARLVHSPAFRRLQGKTQLFAGLESDFFRNRLTHSLEVAQIAKSIAIRLNREKLETIGWEIDTDLMEFAGLAHDLGHPPFGHTGEYALNRLMVDFGGFEGNAQTLRVLARLEKKLDDPERQLLNDGRPRWFEGSQEASVGLNLCSRTLASILKYDREIGISVADQDLGARIQKGYYRSEKKIVKKVKKDVVGRQYDDPLRTVECQIMDLADDIAYSTYDLEDAFKGGLLVPLDLFSAEREILEKVAQRVERETGERLVDVGVTEILLEVFPNFADAEWEGEGVESSYSEGLGYAYAISKEFAHQGFFRTTITSYLVNHLVNAIDISVNEGCPALSQVVMEPHTRVTMSVLKQFVYVMLIESSRFRVNSYRGEKIVEAIFEALWKGDNYDLMPRDYREKYLQAPELDRARVICDFIAGMTDRYAVEFYARLRSENFQTMFKPD